MPLDPPAPLRRLLDLAPGSDIDAAIASVRADVPLGGSTVWMLVCSALLAALGLDTSSTAIVIGAMLISPLMTPILGVGMGLAVLDRELLGRSLRVLAVMTAASLAAATLYFLVTPLGQPTPELLARTRPTLLDVAVAFVGGVAGIVATSRKTMTTAIPGVAIATALMPPLCTAGFGLATGQWTFFAGAFYLFFLNSVFIAAATYGITRLLHPQAIVWENERQHRRVLRLVAALLVATALPASLLLFDAAREAQAQRRAERFVQTALRSDGREVLRWSLSGKQRLLGERGGSEEAVGEVRAVLIGRSLASGEAAALERRMQAAGLEHFRLRLVVVGQTDQFLTPDEIAALRALQAPSGITRAADDAASPDTLRPSGPPQLRAAPETSAGAVLRREARLVVPALDTLAVDGDTAHVRFSPSATARDSAALQVFLHASLDRPVVLAPLD